MQIAKRFHAFLDHLAQFLTVQADAGVVIQLDTADMYRGFLIADAVSALPLEGTDLFQEIDHAVYRSHSDVRISL